MSFLFRYIVKWLRTLADHVTQTPPSVCHFSGKNTNFLGNLAERLRREIRNLLGFPRVGSNPAVVAILFAELLPTTSGVIVVYFLVVFVRAHRVIQREKFGFS
jgi:hypothetical protein